MRGHSALGMQQGQTMNVLIEGLQQHLHQFPDDAEAHQMLGLFLHSNQKEAKAHFKHAEQLFETQHDRDRAVLARVLHDLASWSI
jgi:cytochrome c-type biogenesis protein CcmH/NrfG